MPGPSLTTDAIVVLKRPASDSFQTLSVFTPEHGALRVIQRLPRKITSTHLALDLFDEVTLLLEGAPQGDAWFVKEPRLIARHTGIGRNYDSLVRASSFAALVSRNPVPEETRASVHALLRTAFTAFAADAPADIVYLKCLYSFARDEGYPVKQHWLASLPPALQATGQQLLHTSLATLSDTDYSRVDSEKLLRHLEHYLRSHTEIIMD
ncbi:MAG TPA: hypothetical protein VL357_10420 [Rariglobus sp.]|jgi:recombinational DNA repair protein (RecF pathway)|nr:hypothetical protein [Rariglobus sp.]